MLKAFSEIWGRNIGLPIAPGIFRGCFVVLFFLLFSWFQMAPPHLFAAESKAAESDHHSIDLKALDDVFFRYEKTTNALIEAMDSHDWDKMAKLAKRITQQSQHLKILGGMRKNSSWIYYASNLFHHSLELVHTIDDRDGVEAMKIIITLVSHIGQIQSSHPVWLRHSVWGQVKALKKGIDHRDRGMVRNAAEVIHTSANKILLSVISSPKPYRHTYWKGNIIVINRLGDAIIGNVNRGDWSEVSEHFKRVVHMISRWSDSFYLPYEGGVL